MIGSIFKGGFIELAPGFTREKLKPLGFVKCNYGGLCGGIYPYYDIYKHRDCDKKVVIEFRNESSLDVPIKDCEFDFPEREFIEKRYQETGDLWGKGGRDENQ